MCGLLKFTKGNDIINNKRIFGIVVAKIKVKCISQNVMLSIHVYETYDSHFIAHELQLYVITRSLSFCSHGISQRRSLSTAFVILYQICIFLADYEKMISKFYNECVRKMLE